MAKTFASSAVPMHVESADSLPDIKPYPFFDLAVHPRQWSFVEVEGGKFEWLPDLQKVPYRPGVNAAVFVKLKLSDGSTRSVLKNKDEVRMLRAEKGYAFIDREGPAGDYIRQLETKSGPHYHAAWEVLEYVEGFGVQTSVDAAVKIAFQRKLLAESLVTKPPELFRQRAIREAEDEVQRIAAAPASEAQAAALKRANARLKAMQSTPLPTPGQAAVKSAKK